MTVSFNADKFHYEDSTIIVENEVPVVWRKYGECEYKEEGRAICQIPLKYVLSGQIDFADKESWKTVALCLAEALCSR